MVVQINQFVQNLNRMEFLITLACTGRCKHCSQGEHIGSGKHIDPEIAAQAVRKVASSYAITSLMTFGGEPLLYPEAVYAIHSAAAEMGIPKRQVITNGFFSRDPAKIMTVAQKLAACGVNDVLVSSDAFHQETIPLELVKEFAVQVRKCGVSLRVSPAWLVSEADDNPYNRRTWGILNEFEAMGIGRASGNIIFPSGNAVKYLGDYFDESKEYANPYENDPADIRAICIAPDGDLLHGNIYQTDILKILNAYMPQH